jgi:CheY-like chemotaxis protein
VNSPGTKEDLRIRLLIVDDEQSIRKLCVTVGEALGFVCLEAESGESALALLEEQPVHMVLTDMVMPHMSGLEFLESQKAAAAHRNCAHDWPRVH